MLLRNHADNPFQLELPLAKAYPAGGDVMVENLWYKDAQEGIQVKHFEFFSLRFFLPRLSKKSENQFSLMEMKRLQVENWRKQTWFSVLEETKTTPS